MCWASSTNCLPDLAASSRGPLARLPSVFERKAFYFVMLQYSGKGKVQQLIQVLIRLSRRHRRSAKTITTERLMRSSRGMKKKMQLHTSSASSSGPVMPQQACNPSSLALAVKLCQYARMGGCGSNTHSLLIVYRHHGFTSSPSLVYFAVHE